MKKGDKKSFPTNYLIFLGRASENPSSFFGRLVDTSIFLEPHLEQLALCFIWLRMLLILSYQIQKILLNMWCILFSEFKFLLFALFFVLILWSHNSCKFIKLISIKWLFILLFFMWITINIYIDHKSIAKNYNYLA